MSDAVLVVKFAGPYVSVQDQGRPGLMRFGIPASGPMDRVSFAAANMSIGNAIDLPCVEVSMGGLELECLSGPVTYAVFGGCFAVDHRDKKRISWTAATLRSGDRLSIRPGQWGSWTYLAFAGSLETKEWFGSASTYAPAGFGGGCLSAKQLLRISDAEVREELEGPLPFPTCNIPKLHVHVVLGPQERFFSDETISSFNAGLYRLTSAYDRMGVRLEGEILPPAAKLSMPSEPIIRGSIQVNGEGIATVLLADHQTTGGYPKIATLIDCDLDAFVQMRPGDPVNFQAVSPEKAIVLTRNYTRELNRFFETISEKPKRYGTP